MNSNPSEVIAANLAFMAFWIALVCALAFAGGRWAHLREFRDEMLSQWAPALIVTLLYLLGSGLGSGRWLNPYALAIFCEMLIGLTFARRIPGFEPLPIARAVARRERRWPLTVAVSVILAALMFIPALLIGSVGMSIAQQAFHEVNRTEQAASMLGVDPVQVLFMLLSGAGIAEETTYRLVALSFVWWLTRRAWVAILISALLFAAYHLSPLDGMYQVFWQFPISQFLASFLIGLVWGALFFKRGFESVVLAHTLSDWIPFMIFAR